MGRTPRFREHLFGLAACDGGHASLSDEGQFAGIAQAGRFERLMCHNDAVGTITQGRANAAEFLGAAARTLVPAAPEPEAAAQAYRGEVQAVADMAGVQGGVRCDDPAARSLDDSALRAPVVALTRHARGQEEEALGALERALQAV